jgi:hypothetical protein
MLMYINDMELVSTLTNFEKVDLLNRKRFQSLEAIDYVNKRRQFD